jgi:hypothetical protein
MADTDTHTMLPAIGFWGGMALLISSITGPGLTTSLSHPPSRGNLAEGVFGLTFASSLAISRSRMVLVRIPVRRSIAN